MSNYKQIATEARIKVLELIFKAQTSHIGSNFSAIDIMAVLFEKVDPEKDELILSAGWKAAAWYYFLWKKGIITEEELNSFCQLDSPFIGLTEPMNRWGLRFGGGSMGLGLPAAVGFALSKKLKAQNCERCKRVLNGEMTGLYSHAGCPCDCHGKVYCLMSDGEMQCGTTWESYLISEQHRLNNLVVIIDGNKFQAMGKVQDILNLPGIYDDEIQIDGHNYEEIEDAIKRNNWIYANTVKGKGVSFMENNNLYHYKNLSEEEYNLALKELNT